MQKLRTRSLEWFLRKLYCIKMLKLDHGNEVVHNLSLSALKGRRLKHQVGDKVPLSPVEIYGLNHYFIRHAASKAGNGWQIDLIKVRTEVRKGKTGTLANIIYCRVIVRYSKTRFTELVLSTLVENFYQVLNTIHLFKCHYPSIRLLMIPITKTNLTIASITIFCNS